MDDIKLHLLRICGKKGLPIKLACKKLSISMDIFNQLVSDPDMKWCFYIEESNNKPFEERIINATFSGMTHVRRRRREIFQLVYPSVISTIALLVSLSSFVLALISLLLKLNP